MKIQILKISEFKKELTDLCCQKSILLIVFTECYFPKNMKNVLFAPCDVEDVRFIVRFSHGLTFPSAPHACPTSNAFKLSFEPATFASNNCRGLEMHTVHSDTLLN